MREVGERTGFKSFRRAAETPFNLVFTLPLVRLNFISI